MQTFDFWQCFSFDLVKILFENFSCAFLVLRLPFSIMTMKAMIEGVREISKENPEGRLAAIRFLRRQGLTFPTARTMAEEIIAGKPWYRKSLYRNEK